MNRIVVAVCAVLLSAGGALAQQPAPAGQPVLKDLKQKISYIIGQNIGRQMKNDELEIDVEVLARGLKDALAGAPSLLGEAEVQAAMQEFQQLMMAQDNDRAKTVSDKNKREGEEFLAANKAREGVVTLPSGLQYRVLQKGTGPSPKATDTVRTHYRGTLLDGTVFDSSYDRGQPASFGVNQVIAGWTEALQLMKVGDRWQVFVPASLAYGERGAGEDIGPNATLVFEIELLGIE